jgi:hypothetical protein
MLMYHLANNYGTQAAAYLENKAAGLTDLIPNRHIDSVIGPSRWSPI